MNPKTRHDLTLAGSILFALGAGLYVGYYACHTNCVQATKGVAPVMGEIPRHPNRTVIRQLLSKRGF